MVFCNGCGLLITDYADYIDYTDIKSPSYSEGLFYSMIIREIIFIIRVIRDYNIDFTDIKSLIQRGAFLSMIIREIIFIIRLIRDYNIDFTDIKSPSYSEGLSYAMIIREIIFIIRSIRDYH